ncbi:transcription intermediary factor 1-beta-like [Mytilus trossulus]|uniref:transcription intermediary factor 1-beta-like n=1 Tax=Mytilus trossulus TaxID=6551 RepID=UPI003005F9EB
MSDSTALCDVCCLRHLSKPSTGWCLECEEGLCLDCKEHHSLLKATRNHNIIPISEYQKLPQNVLEITRNCEKHNEVLQIFCKKHDSPCCRKCIIETHNNCKNLIEIEDYIKDIKSSARFQEVEEMMNEAAENIKRIRINREDNLTSLQEEKKRIENDIAQTRIKINNHLDKLQADLIQTLYAKVKKENGKIEQVLKSLEEKQGQINEYQNTFENIKKYATDVQLFLSIKLMETNI